MFCSRRSATNSNESTSAIEPWRAHVVESVPCTERNHNPSPRYARIWNGLLRPQSSVSSPVPSRKGGVASAQTQCENLVNTKTQGYDRIWFRYSYCACVTKMEEVEDIIVHDCLRRPKGSVPSIHCHTGVHAMLKPTRLCRPGQRVDARLHQGNMRGVSLWQCRIVAAVIDHICRGVEIALCALERATVDGNGASGFNQRECPVCKPMAAVRFIGANELRTGGHAEDPEFYQGSS